jgi:hypothetical protein
MLLDSIGLVARFRPDGNGTEGSRVYGPCPASLAGSGYAGMRKRFKARWTTGTKKNSRRRARGLAVPAKFWVFYGFHSSSTAFSAFWTSC